jgi:protocatechuate 3,4-dioxygenase alpha subunit
MSGGLPADEVPVATPSQTVGPFFHVGLTPSTAAGQVLGVSGAESIHVVIRILDGDGAPVSDAVVEIWHAAAIGSEGSAAPPADQPAGFGRLATAEDGACRFETVRPARTAAVSGVAPAAHINLCIFARGLLRHLQTRLYFAGDPALDEDPVLALVPPARRETLVAHPDPGRHGGWLFDVHLQGAQETVFFDA